MIIRSDNYVDNNNYNFFSQVKTITDEDNDMYRIINYVHNNRKNNKNKNKNKNKIKSKIRKLINTKVEAIQYIVLNQNLKLL
jgi:hypothetical protein